MVARSRISGLSGVTLLLTVPALFARVIDGRAKRQPIIHHLAWNASDSRNFGHLEELALMTPVSGNAIAQRMSTRLLTLRSDEYTHWQLLDVPAAVLLNARLPKLYLEIASESPFPFSPHW